MTISLYNLFEAALLVINAVVVLHEDRFLSKIGWGRNQADRSGYGQQQEPGFKANLMNLIHSIRTVMRVPLILLNIVTIVFKIIAG